MRPKSFETAFTKCSPAIASPDELVGKFMLSIDQTRPDHRLISVACTFPHRWNHLFGPRKRGDSLPERSSGTRVGIGLRFHVPLFHAVPLMSSSAV